MRQNSTRIHLVTSPRSKMGANRLAALLPTHCNQVDELKVDEIGARDTIIAHNTIKIPTELRGQSILYALQSIVNMLKKDEDIRQSILNRPFLSVFCNTGTAAHDLAEMGIKSDLLYRPNRLSFPSQAPSLPKQPCVLLYWKGDHPPMAHYKEVVINLIESMPHINFLCFPDAAPLIDAPNVRALGRINISKTMPEVDGMVRICDRYDYGRSTFDVLAHGRWVVYNDMPHELFSYSCPLELIPEFIDRMIKRRSEEDVQKRFLEFYDYFNEDS